MNVTGGFIMGWLGAGAQRAEQMWMSSAAAAQVCSDVDVLSCRYSGVISCQCSRLQTPRDAIVLGCGCSELRSLSVVDVLISRISQPWVLWCSQLHPALSLLEKWVVPCYGVSVCGLYYFGL